MSKYLCPRLIETSFKRLSPSSNRGKKPLERTSGLMYFLAFDAAAKSLACCPLDLKPDTREGKNNRQSVELEFVRLVKLKSGKDGETRQVSVLGQIEEGGTSPEKRISSNFLTVPLKKASHSVKSYKYPSRPAPLLKMGGVATGRDWGIAYHDDWRENLPKFLSEVKSNTPFTDLAIFVFRNYPISEECDNIRDALKQEIGMRFSNELTQFWCGRIDSEKLFFKYTNPPFSDSYQEPLADKSNSNQAGEERTQYLNSIDKEALIERVIYLEGILDAQRIKY